jgi:hypothetical protein
MTTLVGIFDQPEQVEAVVQQLGLAHIKATSVTVTPYPPPGADGAIPPALLVTVHDVPRDAEARVSTILEMAGMREVGSPAPPPGTEPGGHSETAILAEEALAGAAGALAGGVLGSLVAGPAGGLAGLAIGGAAGAGGAHLSTAPATPSSGPALAGAAGALAGIALGTVAGPGGAVVGGLVGAAAGAAIGEAVAAGLAPHPRPLDASQ